MSRLVSIFIVVLLLVILMVLTNPTENQFIDWAVKQAENNADSKIERILGDVLGRSVLQLSTTRRDFLAFSIFTIDKGNAQGVFLGFLRYIFIQLN